MDSGNTAEKKGLLMDDVKTSFGRLADVSDEIVDDLSMPQYASEVAKVSKSKLGKAVKFAVFMGAIAGIGFTLKQLFSPSGGNWEPHVPSAPYLSDPLIEEELDEVNPG